MQCNASQVTDPSGVERVCLKLTVPIAGRLREEANWIEEIDVLESIFSETTKLNLQYRNPSELIEFANWAVAKRNAEDFQPTFLHRVMGLMEPVPSALLELFQISF